MNQPALSLPGRVVLSDDQRRHVFEIVARLSYRCGGTWDEPTIRQWVADVERYCAEDLDALLVAAQRLGQRWDGPGRPPFSALYEQWTTIRRARRTETEADAYRTEVAADRRLLADADVKDRVRGMIAEAKHRLASRTDGADSGET